MLFLDSASELTKTESKRSLHEEFLPFFGIFMLFLKGYLPFKQQGYT